MFDDAALIFALDISAADADREAQHLTEWLIQSGWATPELTPGPRALATGAVTEQQGGRLLVIAGPTLNMQGVDMEGPNCPYCSAQVDIVRLTDDVSDDTPYPVVQCEACGRDVEYTDWIGTAHPVMSNLTLELDEWIVFDGDPQTALLVDGISQEMGGRWRQIWSHW